MASPVLFLDSASAYSHEISWDVARDAALKLVSVIKGIRKENSRIAINCCSSFSSCLIGTNHTISSAFAGPEFRDEWNYLRTLQDRSPFEAGFEQYVDIVSLMSCKTKVSKLDSIASAWAILVETGILSFYSRPDWQVPIVEAELTKLLHDGNVETESVQIVNASCNEHVLQHLSWIKTLGLQTNPSGLELWKERETRFPRLYFLPRVENDLHHLSSTGAPYIQALNCLALLNESACNWQSASPFPEFATKVTPEGEQRKQFCYFFDDKLGRRSLFDLHARFTGGFPGRIHLRCDATSRIIVIAYVGFKLERSIEN